MSGFSLRKEGDTSNPQSVRAVGEQSTAGQLAYWKHENGFLYLISLLGTGEKLFKGETSAGGFHSEGFFDSITWYRYGGFALTPFDITSDTGDFIFHKGYETDPVLGYADPDQGRPHFFPELDFTFSGRPYTEARLPKNLSGDGTTEPTDSEMRLRTSCFWDYDNTGARVGALPTFSPNPARLFAFAARCANMNIATRVDWPSWVTFRDACDYALPWKEGEGDGLLGEYYTTIDLTGTPTTQIDTVVDFDMGTVPVLSRRWTGFVKPPETGTYTFSTLADDGVKLWVNNVLIIDDWTTHAALERSGTIALTGGQTYAIKLEFFNGSTSPASVKLLWAMAPKIAQQVIPQPYLFSTQAIIDNGRTIPRHSADMVLQGIPWPTVFDTIMLRAPSFRWQSVNGVIRFIESNTRQSVKTFIYETGIPFEVDVALNTFAVGGNEHGLPAGAMLRLANKEGLLPGATLVGGGTRLQPQTNYYVRDVTLTTFKLAQTLGGAAIDITDAGVGESTYTMKSNIVQSSVVAQRTDPLYKPNFIVLGYRNKADQQFVQSWVEVGRDDLRDLVDGKVIDPGIIQIGVAHQSEADRIVEATMRRSSDRDIEVQLRGQKDSDEVAKNDLVKLVHPRGDWRLTPFTGHLGPVDMEVVDEKYESTISTANEKSFILKIWRPEYDDLANQPLMKRSTGYVPSPLTPPPVVANVTLTERLWSTPDLTYALAIDAVVQFSNLNYPFDQRGRVWWRKPENEIAFTVTAATDVVTADSHGYANGTPLLLRNVGGALPAGTDGITTYFVINQTANTFKLAKSVGGSAVDITGVGTGTHYVAPFQVTDTVITPNTETLQAAFTLLGGQQGIHAIKVVSESLLQQKRPFEQHPIFTMNLAPPRATILKVFDNVPPKDALSGPGLTIGVARGAGPGSWFGAAVLRDRGYGYEPFAPSIMKEALIGHTTDNGINWLGDGSGGAYSILWFIKEGGPDPTNATPTEITAGKNNYFVGREKLGVQTWTDQGGGLWKGENLIRALNHTEIFQATHTVQEDMMQLDENIFFIQIERRDIGAATFNLKAQTFGQTLADAAVTAVVVRGDSIRPYAPSDLEMAVDASEDLHIQELGYPRVEERPESYTARIRRFSDSVLLRDLPMIPGIASMAGIFPDTSGSVVVTNNKIQSGGGSGGFARSAQRFSAAGSYLDFVGSVATNDLSWWVDLIPASLSPWDTLFGQLYRIAVFSLPTNNHLVILQDEFGSNLWTGYLSSPLKVRIAFVGTEVRYYSDWQNPSTPPLFIDKRPPVFPMRVRVHVRGSGTADKIVFGGLVVPQTIYARRQSEYDNELNGGTGPCTDVTVESWQDSPIVEIQNKGFSTIPERFVY